MGREAWAGQSVRVGPEGSAGQNRWADPESSTGEGLRPDTGAPKDDNHSTVTVLYEGRRLDLLLPSAVTCAELLPMLLRLLLPSAASEIAGVTRNDQHTIQASTNAANGIAELAQWQLSRIGGGPLNTSETLDEAGVLDGDLLEIHRAARPRPVLTGRTARDRVEDLVNHQARYWTDQTSIAFTHIAVLVVAIGLFVPVTQLPLGLAMAGLAGTLAVTILLVATTMASRSAAACANLALLTGCAWACLAGTSAFVCQVADRGSSTRTAAVVLTELLVLPGPVPGWLGSAAVTFDAVTVGAATALLLAVCSTAHQPAAVVYVAALTMIVCSLLAMVAAVMLGLPAMATAKVIAVSALLTMGGLPRAALLAGGLTNVHVIGDTTTFDKRFDRSDRILAGGVIGVSFVAAVVAVLGSFTGSRLDQLFAGGVGLTLLLRSRAFSQIPHAAGPRIAGLLVLASLWVTSYRGATHVEQGLLLVVATGGVAVAMVSMGRLTTRSPVGRARASRLLSVAEQLLVVMLVVLAVGTSGLFDWTHQVLR